MADKMCTELEGIFLWAFEGLQRLASNGFRFTESNRARQNREVLKQDGNNLLMFFESEDYIRFEPGYDATSKELYAVYCIWCDENGFTPLKPRTVSDYVAANAVKLGVEHCNTVYSVEGRRVWGFKGIHLMIDSGIRNRLGMQKVYPDDNPFR